MDVRLMPGESFCPAAATATAPVRRCRLPACLQFPPAPSSPSSSPSGQVLPPAISRCAAGWLLLAAASSTAAGARASCAAPGAGACLPSRHWQLCHTRLHQRCVGWGRGALAAWVVVRAAGKVSPPVPPPAYNTPLLRCSAGSPRLPSSAGGVAAGAALLPARCTTCSSCTGGRCFEPSLSLLRCCTAGTRGCIVGCSSSLQHRQRWQYRSRWQYMRRYCQPGTGRVPHQPIPYRTAAPASNRAAGCGAAPAPEVGGRVATVAARIAVHAALLPPSRCRRTELSLPLPPSIRCRQQETFSIHLGRLEAFANDDRTRAFLSLAAEEGSPGGSAAAAGGSSAAATAGGGSAGAAGAESAAAAATAIPTSSGDGSSDSEEVQAQAQSPYSSQLVSLCHAVSQVFAAHGLPRFYADPRPHASGGLTHSAGLQLCGCLPSLSCSQRCLLPHLHQPSLHAPAVAWLLGDQRQQLEAALAAPDVAEAAARLAAQPWQLRPSAVVCKAGQREHMVWQAPGS